MPSLPGCSIIRRTPSLVCLLLLLVACEPAAQPRAPQDRPPPLLLISIDGFRHDYFDRADTPALDRLATEGLKADSLHHVFPTKTFPTHYSLVTGVHPGRHGVVANSMWDPQRGSRFSMRDRSAVGDGYWYRDAEPIWVTAERQGLRAATYFWPGSEARIDRLRPSYWKLYDASVPHADRVRQILDWLDLPDDERPDVLTLYFSAVDSAGHRHGPDSEATGRAVADVDRHLGNLLDGLEARDLLGRMHILVVSDHGMSEVDLDRYIRLDDYLDLGRVRVSDWGPAAQIWATEMAVDDIVAALDGAHPHLRVWPKADVPARYVFDRHHRVPDVVAEADPGWMISNRAYLAGLNRFSLRGMHGWDPAWLEMHGILLAHGPAFTANSRAPSFRSVDLYALMTELLTLEAADHDGSLTPFAPYLNAPVDPAYEWLLFACPDELLEARVAEGHMALRHRGRVHVLTRAAGSGRRFEQEGLRFEFDDGRARARIEGQTIDDCRVQESGQQPREWNHTAARPSSP